jgi:hypothetical protein
MNTNTIAIIASLFVALAAFAQTPSGKEPERLTSLRLSWQQAKKKATEPLDLKYQQELERIKDTLTKAGDLNGALAVQTELEQLRPKTPSDEQTTKGLLSQLRRTRWELDEGGGPAHITFQGNEVLWEDEKTAQKWTLKISQQKDGSLLIDWGGAARRVEVTPDLSSLTVARAVTPDKKVTAQKEKK